MNDRATKIIQPIYCAIYTRKSSSEGLDQEFTTLDAQREAGENYIKSQKSQGWIALKDKYNDGGYTGADTNRPALKALIEDVRIGKINCVVVYKVDRLSRSLMDFTRLLEFFDEYNTTFVSVTQHFNTDTSMGRLTLNILLSFAQFEREMISERTRDKIGAARKKGKWTGGLPPLGYDIDRETHKLVVNEQEARVVRKTYKLYLETSSILNTTIILNEQGYTCKRYVAKTGRQFGGGKFSNNIIHRMLMNPVYTGKIKHQGILYNGEHEAVIEPELFKKVQEQIKYNRVNRKVHKNAKCFGLLSQILRCSACDCVMIHTYSVKKKVKKYRYYVCLKAQRLGYATCPTRSLNAKDIEDTVIAHLPRIKIKNNPLLLDKYKDVTFKILPVWETLVPDERRRIITYLFESIDYNAETKSLGFNLNEKGIYELYAEIHMDKKQCEQNSKST